MMKGNIGQLMKQAQMMQENMRRMQESLGISLPAVKSRVHRSRLFVRKQLADYLKTA